MSAATLLAAERAGVTPLAPPPGSRQTQGVSRCPYTWVRNFLGVAKPNASEATQLRVTVRRGDDETVNVALPARSARWLVDLIPADVVEKIRAEEIPLDAIQDELARAEKLIPHRIFELVEPHRAVTVWLE